MNDRELLQMAAKAACVEGGWGERVMIGDDEVDLTDIWFLDSPETCEIWDPLTDDGDALRLAVKLDLHVQCDFTEEESKVYVYGAFLGNGIEEEPGELDKYGATRRAIVRAAAEIGKAM